MLINARLMLVRLLGIRIWVPIRILPCVLDLGRSYSADFKHSHYIANQDSEARKLFGFIFHNFHTHESRILLYKTHVRPLFQYCPFILDSTHRGTFEFGEIFARVFADIHFYFLTYNLWKLLAIILKNVFVKPQLF